MKLLVVLVACVALAAADPLLVFRGQGGKGGGQGGDKGGQGGDRDGDRKEGGKGGKDKESLRELLNELRRADGDRKGGDRGGDRDGDKEGDDGRDFFEGALKYIEENKPLSIDEVKSMLGQAKGLFEKVSGHFDALKEDGPDGEWLADLENIHDTDLAKLYVDAVKKFERLSYLGVEDQGQCHHILGLLIRLYKEQKDAEAGTKREQEEFEEQVMEAGKKEVGCIQSRMRECIGLIQHFQDTIAEAQSSGEEVENVPLKVEVMLGSVKACFENVYRQVAIFAGTVQGLMHHAAAAEAGDARESRLRELYDKASEIKRELESMKNFH